MAVCHFIPNPNNTPAVYVVYSWYDSTVACRVIRVNTVVLATGIVDTETVWASPSPEPLCTPSIASTPGGEQGPEYVHVAWLRTQNPESGPQLWYGVKYHPNGGWEDIARVSEPPPDDYEPAFNPSVEGYGDSVYVVWRAKEQGDQPGMIWRAQRPLDASPPPPPWDVWQVDFDERSFDHRYTDCPQMATRFAHVWHERTHDTNEDIYANLFMWPPIYQLWNDELRSVYPSICVELLMQPLILYTVWTNEAPPAYKVKF
jgi:hypothetical protein